MAWQGITKTDNVSVMRKYFKSLRFLTQDILREIYLDTSGQFLEKGLGNSIYLHTTEDYVPNTFPEFRGTVNLKGYGYSRYLPDSYNSQASTFVANSSNSHFSRDVTKTRILECVKIGAIFGTTSTLTAYRDSVNDNKAIIWSPWFNAFPMLYFYGITENNVIIDLGNLQVDSISADYVIRMNVVAEQSGTTDVKDYFFGSIPSVVSFWAECPISEGEISFALPKGCSVFGSTEDLQTWLLTGIDNGDYTKEEVKPTPETVSHYIFSNTKIGDSLDTSSFTNLSGMNRCNFKIKPDAKIVGYVNKNYPYNVHVKISDGGLVESNEQIDGGEFSPWSSSFTNDKWTYKEVVYNGNADKYYIGQPFGITFPIYATESQADGYLGGTTSITDSLYDGQNGNWNAPQNQTGERYAETNFNVDNPNNVKLSKTILCDANVMQDISRILYTETETFQDVLNGLDLYGEVPLSFIVDCFWLPFNPKPFCVTSRNQTFAFGKYYTQLNHEFDEVLSTNKVVQVAKANFVGSFNDFRDYYTRYYLYLPYVNLVELSAETYLYKEMTVQVYFDVRSGSIKYYILANGVVQDVFSGSIRMDMAIIGTDNYSASRNKLSIGGNAIADTFGGAMNTIGQIKMGNPIGASTSALSTANNGIVTPTLELTKASPKQIIGGFSAEQSLMDSLDIVLYVESKEIEFDDNIRQMYQIADNRVGKLGSCNGFVLFDDLRLSTDASEDEKTLLMQQVSSGIII